MHIYIIQDVYTALSLAFRNFFGWVVLIWGLLIAPYFFTESGGYVMPTSGVFFNFAVVMTVIILIQSIIIYLANRRYVIDLNTGLITFPRSDVENSILAIILMYPYWNLMRTKTIHASEIENIYLNTKRWSSKSRVANGTTSTGKMKYRTETTRHVNYTMNVVGRFGSANLLFLDRQKRDEVRNAIQKCVKSITGENIDRKVAEFN